MATRSLLYARSIAINEHIEIPVPTVGEVLDREDEYYGMVSLVTATPYDLMVQLDDIGIDFAQIDDFDLFLIVFNSLKDQDTSMIFGDLDLSRFEVAINQENNMIVLLDEKNEIVIDKLTHWQIAESLRKLHHQERSKGKPANEEARAFMIQRARIKMARRRNRVEDSHLEQLVVSIVNTEQYPYDFEQTRDLTIYQFNESVHQIIRKIDFDNKMFGIYSGTISAKDLNQKELNWLTH